LKIQHTLPELAIIQTATITDEEKVLIYKCRGDQNRLGFCYQMMFVKVFNRFPIQVPLEMQDQILTFASLQMSMPTEDIQTYKKRQQTISQHQIQIRTFLKLKSLDAKMTRKVNKFLLVEAQRTENRSVLLAKMEQFLKEQKILRPAIDTLERLIVTVRKKAHQQIYTKVMQSLTQEQQQNLDDLVKVVRQPVEQKEEQLLPDEQLEQEEPQKEVSEIIEDDEDDPIYFSQLQRLKQPPAHPSAKSLLALTEKLTLIQSTKILELDMNWINNNYKRELAKYVLRCPSKRIREVRPAHRYTALVCFLHQLNLDTKDQIVDLHHKLMLKVYKWAQNEKDEAVQKKYTNFKQSQIFLNTIGKIIMDKHVKNADIRKKIFAKIDRDALKKHMAEMDNWFNSKYSHLLHLVVERFSYIRQFSPSFVASLDFEAHGEKSKNIVAAITVLKTLNQEGKRVLPKNAPVNFIPKKLRPLVISGKTINKKAWECALLSCIREEIKVGNLTVKDSKRFGHFDDFFMPAEQWERTRDQFFERSKLPKDPKKAIAYLTQKHHGAVDNFLAKQKGNNYAKIGAKKFVLSVEPAEKLTKTEKKNLKTLESWISQHMRIMRLPQLLIEVDNDLHFTQEFMLPHQKNIRDVDTVCGILASIMAHGCFIGPYTMARLMNGVSYKQIQRITDWQLTEEAHRFALAKIVNAIGDLEISKEWGPGETSSSDEQRFEYHRKTAQQTFSVKLRDFALGFYTFVADNYAPYFSQPMECTNRDAPYVLDGILYNESDLDIQEHFTDTHGYTEINYAVFGMLGKTFSPRIKNVKEQRIYRIDDGKNYGDLEPIVAGRNKKIHLEWIEEYWDKIAYLCASLESGFVTASTVLKRLNGFSPKNHFYRAIRELGRLFKTENILNYLSDPVLRQKRRRGLLKGEEIHQLARDVGYGKRGKITARDVGGQRNTCSCLTLIMAGIIYWQAKEIWRVIKMYGHKLDLACLKMLPHISPIGWDNLILYGEYAFNKDLIEP
jgi:TnpA family transposase